MIQKEINLPHYLLPLIYYRSQYEIVSHIKCFPSVFFPLLKLRQDDLKRSVDKNTSIVIEGFPRSANCFAVETFKAAQVTDISIAHHLHAPAQIIRAVQYGLPTLVLIRDPIEAVISYLAMRFEIYDLKGITDFPPTLEQLFKEYIRFYKTVLPLSNQFIIGRFEEVTNDFGTIIDKLNQKFNTNFISPLLSNNNQSETMVQTKKLHASSSNLRNPIKNQLKTNIQSYSLKYFIKDAKAIYNEFKYLSENNC